MNRWIRVWVICKYRKLKIISILCLRSVISRITQLIIITPIKTSWAIFYLIECLILYYYVWLFSLQHSVVSVLVFSSERNHQPVVPRNFVTKWKKKKKPNELTHQTHLLIGHWAPCRIWIRIVESNWIIVIVNIVAGSAQCVYKAITFSFPKSLFASIRNGYRSWIGRKNENPFLMFHGVILVHIKLYTSYSAYLPDHFFELSDNLKSFLCSYSRLKNCIKVALGFLFYRNVVVKLFP